MASCYHSEVLLLLTVLKGLPSETCQLVNTSSSGLSRFSESRLLIYIIYMTEKYKIYVLLLIVLLQVIIREFVYVHEPTRLPEEFGIWRKFFWQEYFVVNSLSIRNINGWGF